MLFNRWRTENAETWLVPRWHLVVEPDESAPLPPVIDGLRECRERRVANLLTGLIFTNNADNLPLSLWTIAHL